MTPARPQLAAVLAALTDTSPDAWASDRRLNVRVAEGGVTWDTPSGLWTTETQWITDDPAFAWEVMQTRGLIPEGYVGRFVCRTCAECYGSPLDAFCGDCGRPIAVCDPPAPMPHPTTLPDLVAFLSRGFAATDDGTPGILGMEEYAAAMYPTRTVAWEVSDQPTFAMLADGAEFRFPRDGWVAIAIPSLGSSRTGTLVFPADGGVSVIDRDGRVIPLGTATGGR